MATSLEPDKLLTTTVSPLSRISVSLLVKGKAREDKLVRITKLSANFTPRLILSSEFI